jgi:Tfp pilus assembly protein PilW
MIGQPMVDSGDCLFGDGRGVAQLAVSASSASSAEAVYETGRRSADNQYLQVDELDTGDKGYIAYKNTSAQAMVITPKGGFTITMSGFEQWDGFQYEQPIRNVISALPR